MASGFRLTGNKEMQAKLAKLAKSFPKDVKTAIYREAERIMTRSKNEFVPVRFGTLKNSGRVFMLGTTRAILTYGGDAEPYAWVVHEYPSDIDPPSWDGKTVIFKPTGRGAKYLETPMLEAIPNLLKNIAKEIKIG